VTYWIYFDPAGTSNWQKKENRLEGKGFLLPSTQRQATTTVRNVYPTADKLPENQLKFYLHFSAPMSQGEAYKHVHLFKENGEEIKYPFLELGEELWDASGKRFTLFFDPGRIKRGLKPREEMGPALEDGHRYVFVVDAAWRDAEGNPLREQFRKSFTVGPPDDVQPDPKGWKFTFPHLGTREALVVDFPEPLDHALVERLLRVKDAAGKAIEGSVKVSEEEKRWEFVPAEPWSAEAQYALNVETYLEDLAGNSIAKPFEVDLFNAVDKETRIDVVKIPLPLRKP
jgi:hypothetical protein